jgi:ferritin-like metal-binding protein YciE
MESQVRELLTEELRDAYSAEKQAAAVYAMSAAQSQRPGVAGWHRTSH